MVKLKCYFKRENPTQLQDEVIFNILLHFGQRGREHLRILKKTSISFGADSDERQYGYISEGLPSKNRLASMKRSAYEDIKQARMYECIENAECCPLRALNVYLSKLRGNDSLFPKPLNKFSETEWYSGKAIRGKDWLGRFMNELSKKAGLSKVYTNHCVRVTAVTKLHDSGFSCVDICAVTGHKSEASVKRYIRYKDDNSLASFSKALSKTGISEGACSSSMSDKAEWWLSESHKVSVSRNKKSKENSEPEQESENKKARLYTSWGRLEIDL